jgi:hypothetical protein
MQKFIKLPAYARQVSFVQKYHKAAIEKFAIWKQSK